MTIIAEVPANIVPISLGEIRGLHWSLFRQAIRPPKDMSVKFAEL